MRSTHKITLALRFLTGMLFCAAFCFSFSAARAKNPQPPPPLGPTTAAIPAARVFPQPRNLPANVAQLKVAWTFHTGASQLQTELIRKAAFESTPSSSTTNFSLPLPTIRSSLRSRHRRKLWDFDPHVNLSRNYSEVTSRESPHGAIPTPRLAIPAHCAFSSALSMPASSRSTPAPANCAPHSVPTAPSISPWKLPPLLNGAAAIKSLPPRRSPKTYSSSALPSPTIGK